MKILKNTLKYLLLVFIFTACKKVNLLHDSSRYDIDVFRPSLEISEFKPGLRVESLDCFEYAELVTGFSAEVLRGIAATESHFRVTAVGDNKMSLGMFQLHSIWYESRVKKWGDFDPINPYESAVIAGRIMQENLIAFNGDLRMAIAAYKQGILGVRKRGVIQYYVDDVLNWRNDSEKMLSFSLFCGITNTEVLQDEYKGTGTQDSYKFDDFVSIQVSWRGSSSVSD